MYGNGETATEEWQRNDGNRALVYNCCQNVQLLCQIQLVPARLIFMLYVLLLLLLLLFKYPR